MSTEFKLKLTGCFLVLCLIGLLVQGTVLWRLNQSQAETEEYADIPKSIMERLEARLDKQPQSPVSTAFGSDPLVRMQQMQQDMDSLFNSFSPFGSVFGGSARSGMQSFRLNTSNPGLQLRETEDEYQLLVQAPADHELVLNTELEDNLLSVSGTLSSKQSTNSSGIASNFVSSSRFARRFDLDKPVDEMRMVTEQTVDGLLVRVPKTS